MRVNQIAVFLENRKGRLHALLGALSDARVNVESLNIADTRDFGIVRLVTDDNDKAQLALTAAGFTTARGDLVGIEVPDKPAPSPRRSASSAKRASTSNMFILIREAAAKRSSSSRRTTSKERRRCSNDRKCGRVIPAARATSALLRI